MPLLRRVLGEVVEDFAAALAFQVFLQAEQRQSHHVTMMQLGAEALLELEPEVVDAVQVFGPEAGRMGAQVDVCLLYTSPSPRD